MSDTNHRFGRFEIQPRERRVLIDGVPAPLQARAFDLLLVLAQNRHRVLSRAELYDLVWAGRVVEDNNLAVQVHALRKLLGEQAVVTVPGRGYRFVLVADSDAAESEASEPPPRDAAPRADRAPARGAALPMPAAMLLGRGDEMAELDALLGANRLVTVLGAGGIGKTSCALAAAHARQEAQPGGVVWVELAQVLDPALLAGTVARAFGLPAPGGDDALRALASALEAVQALLVLDNAEHLVDAVARLVSTVLTRAPGVRLLVTSQAALKVEGEHIFRLGPLAVPETGTELGEATDYGAVALFAAAAHAADRRFELSHANVTTVIELCRQLDGLALAIKLAAARVPFLGLRGLHDRIAERLKVIGGGQRHAPTRQQTLRAALDWSYGLLSSEEQAVFRSLGVFVGGFTLTLAIDVARDARLDEAAVVEVLSVLVDRSLVVAGDDDPPRYRLLESAREYALLRLEAACEDPVVRQRHALAVLSWLRREDGLRWVVSDIEQVRAAPELNNVRAALDWSAGHDKATAVALIAFSGWLFGILNVQMEYLRRIPALEPFVAKEAPASVAAKFWVESAFVHVAWDSERAYDSSAKAMALFGELGDARGSYFALAMKMWSACAPACERSGLLDDAAGLEQQGLPPKLLALGHVGRCRVLTLERRYVEAARAAEAAQAYAMSAEATRIAVVTVAERALVHYVLGEFDAGMQLCHRAAALEKGRRHSYLEAPLAYLAVGLVLKGELAEARQVLKDLFQRYRAGGGRLFNLSAGAYLLLAAGEGRSDAAARLLGYLDRKARLRLDFAMLLEHPMQDARSALELAFDRSTLQRLYDEGALLDEEAVCAWTLGDVESAAGLSP